MKKNIVAGFTAVTIAALGVSLTACGSDDEGKPVKPSKVAEKTYKDLPKVSNHEPDPQTKDMTAYSVAVAWDQGSYEEQRQTCADLTNMNHKQAENKLRVASNYSDELDYEYAINLLILNCTAFLGGPNPDH